MQLKQTKIVATISDNRCDVEFIRELFEAGMNVVRMNTAHANRDGFERLIANVRAVSNRIAILMDTKGPEIRTTPLEGEPIPLKFGDRIRMAGNPDQLTNSDCICVSYPHFVQDLQPGNQVLIDDGDLELIVVEKHDDYLLCEVQNDATLLGRKSVNVPGTRINLPSLTEKDRNNILYAIEKDIDFIAHSFVRNKQDVMDIREILDAHQSDIKIIAKIENQEGVNNIDEILDCVYGVMVARGDLGIEVPIEQIPFIQRKLIRKCIEAKKPVIVATQMLHTMIKNPRPTRAEVTDIANAIYHRTDAIMLSGETTYGKYPVEAVQTMSKVAGVSEDAKDSRNDIPVPKVKGEITTCLAEAAVGATKELPIKALITDSFTGKTTRYLAAFRSPIPVYSLAYEPRVARELALSYGVFPEIVEEGKSKGETLRRTLDKILAEGELEQNDLVAYIGGSFGSGTSFLEIVTVENLLKKIELYH